MIQTRLENFVDLILNSIADGVFTVDTNFRITSFNQAAVFIISVVRFH